MLSIIVSVIHSALFPKLKTSPKTLVCSTVTGLLPEALMVSNFSLLSFWPDSLDLDCLETPDFSVGFRTFFLFLASNDFRDRICRMENFRELTEGDLNLATKSSCSWY